jgi:hypothetical protein
MKNKLLLFSLMLLAGGFLLMPDAAQAQTTSVADTTSAFTAEIPVAARWEINPDTQSFISAGTAVNTAFGIVDFDATTNNVGTSSTHQIIVGDGGTTAGSDTYFETNATARADATAFTITITGTNGTTATISALDNINLVKAGGNGDGIDVDVIINTSAFPGVAAPPTLGARDFAFSVDHLALAAGPFGGGWTAGSGTEGAKAPLNMGLDFDEGSLDYGDTITSDAAGTAETIGFTLTFTAVDVLPY